MSRPSDDEMRDRFADVLLSDVMPVVDANGYAIQGVFATEDGQSSFCYTVGLTGWGWPEMIVLGPTEWSEVLLEAVVHFLQHAEGIPVPGDLPDFMESGYPLRLRACSTRSAEFPFSTANAIYPATIGLQILVPDDDHRYPDEDGASSLSWQKLVP